ncbi:hypothetical protein RvY_15414 [Ramazzottius varieornatus]|uniref:YTH domain-containing protein n=1 Tax=Ramazzottius varieornatus TaxID=947166 RepID=A0A1D1VW35_RAMVA|nr:hypothetical protein RvY_15414 [Ramazzottius varieornatus]
MSFLPDWVGCKIQPSEVTSSYPSMYLSNYGMNKFDTMAHSPSSNSIWSSSPADSDHDSWLHRGRGSSESPALRTSSNESSGRYDDVLGPIADLASPLYHPYGKIATRAEDTVALSSQISNLSFTGSRTTASPTLSSGSSSGYSSLLTTFDSSKLFPLNPVAKEFVPAPKSWAAIASSTPNAKASTNSSVKTVPGGGGRQKAALPTSLKSPAKPAALKGRNSPTEKQKEFQPERAVPHKQHHVAAKGDGGGFVPSFMQSNKVQGKSSWKTLVNNGSGRPKQDYNLVSFTERETSELAPQELKRLPPSELYRRIVDEVDLNLETADLSFNNARFFVLKPGSEQEIFESVLSSTWSSSSYGNEVLGTAYNSQKGASLFLFFSINGSGHFCGMAEIVSPLCYTATNDPFAGERKRCQFKIKWIFIKDIPNASLRHITIESNGIKSVVNSKDATEVSPTEAAKMAKVFQSCASHTSVLRSVLFKEAPHRRKSHAER